MDRRQEKTREAILNAFGKLLQRKSYGKITVQQIIDEANVGRSTFYAHFATKDELLKALCTTIFSHVFAKDLASERTHDFSNSKDLASRLSHILYHLKDNEKNVMGILAGESSALFMIYFKAYLADMFTLHLDTQKSKAPADFILNHFVGSFAETVLWWINQNMTYSPEDTVKYYLDVSGITQMMK